MPFGVFFLFEDNRKKFPPVGMIRFFFILPIMYTFEAVHTVTFVTLIFLLRDRYDALITGLIRFVTGKNGT